MLNGRIIIIEWNLTLSSMKACKSKFKSLLLSLIVLLWTCHVNSHHHAASAWTDVPGLADLQPICLNFWPSPGQFWSNFVRFMGLDILGLWGILLWLVCYTKLTLSGLMGKSLVNPDLMLASVLLLIKISQNSTLESLSHADRTLTTCWRKQRKAWRGD